MYISELILKNFLSYKDEKYIFEIGKPLLIQGINRSKDSQESNGSGKSGLQSALEYLLLKSTSRKGRDIDLIRRGQKEAAVVECSIVCPMRKRTLNIVRTIPIKGSTTIEIKINNVKQDIATVPDGNAFILDWLQITVEDLQNYYIINKERYTSFYSSSNAKLLSLISRFANINIIDGVDEKVQEDVDVIDTTISELEEENIKLNSRQETLKEQLESELNRDIKQENLDLISSTESKIKTLKDENVALTEEAEGITDVLSVDDEEYKKIQIQFTKLEETIKKKKNDKYSSKINNIDESIEVINKDVTETNDIKDTFTENIDSIDKELRKINVSLAGSVTCPKCEYEFIPESEDTIEVLNDKVKSHNAERQEASDNIEEVEGIISDLNKSIIELKADLKKVELKRDTDKAAIKLLKGELDTLEENLSAKSRQIASKKRSRDSNIETVIDNEDTIERHNKAIKDLKSAKLENVVIKELKEKIKTCIQDIEVKSIEIRDKQDERFKVSQWIFNFQKFRSKLAQESLLVIQNKVNEQLKEMKSEMRLKLGGFKQNANGTIKEKITPTIIDNGEEVTFSSQSGGERVRIDFATILGLQDIINQTHPYGGLDMVWTDEIGEGIDPLGLKLLMKSMPENRTVLVTTHVSIKDLYEGILTVENVNGISSILKN